MDKETKNINIIISIREGDYPFLASFNNGPNRVFRTPYEILEAIAVQIDQLVFQEIILGKHIKIQAYKEKREINSMKFFKAIWNWFITRGIYCLLRMKRI